MTGLDIATIVRELETAGIRYILTGSVAAAAYGVPVEPKDLDIVPDLDTRNLTRLAEVLRRWNAKPVPNLDWAQRLTPAESQRWTPDPPTPERLDHLLATPHGLFDVVPVRSGAYADLVERALPIAFENWTILVAHPADLIASLRLHKTKHQTRLPHLSAVRERLENGGTIVVRLPVG